MAEVRWSVSAADDLRAIEDWIARDSPRHAIEFVDRLVEATEKLSRLPRSGRVVPEFGRRDLREVVFRGYRIVYLLRPRVVTVVRVVHGARDLDALAEGEGWRLL
jgi:plasmid stabilization system protein ParE